MSSGEEASQTSSSTSHFIGKKDDIIKTGRVTKLVNGCRDVLVLYHQGQFYAMDMRCYRKCDAVT